MDEDAYGQNEVDTYNIIRCVVFVLLALSCND